MMWWFLEEFGELGVEGTGVESMMGIGFGVEMRKVDLEEADLTLTIRAGWFAVSRIIVSSVCFISFLRSR